jgi:glycogen(starch) synthase
MNRQHYDVLYCEGPGDIVSAYDTWKQGRDFSSETSVTFSGQVFDFCRLEKLSVCAISYCARADQVIDDGFLVINLPRWRINIPKIGYDLTLIAYTLRLLPLVFRIRPKMILMNSGTTDWTLLSLMRFGGAKIVPIMHNALWTEGFPPTGVIAAVRRRMLEFFWRHSAWLTLAVSPAIRRQVESVSGPTPKSVIVFQPTFPLEAFESPAVKDFKRRPFRIMFAGRIEENKGVFDLLAMAQILQARRDRAFEFDICGDGPMLENLRQRIEAQGLGGIVRTYGRLNRPELIERYLESHIVIVPTKKSFAEGFAMVVAEAILLLRPVVTSSVVPAGEVLKGAVVMATPDDVQSYAEQIEALSKDEGRYLNLVNEARSLRAVILNESSSFLSKLRSLRPLMVTSGIDAGER